MKILLTILICYFLKDFHYEILSLIANDTMIIINIIGIDFTIKVIKYKILRLAIEYIYD